MKLRGDPLDNTALQRLHKASSEARHSRQVTVTIDNEVRVTSGTSFETQVLSTQEIARHKEREQVKIFIDKTPPSTSSKNKIRSQKKANVQSSFFWSFSDPDVKCTPFDFLSRPFEASFFVSLAALESPFPLPFS